MTEEKRESTRPDHAGTKDPGTGEHAIPAASKDAAAADGANDAEAGAKEDGDEKSGQPPAEAARPKSEPAPADAPKSDRKQSAPPTRTEGETSAKPEPKPDPLVAEVTELKAERERLKDQLLRTAADFDNYRKRARRDLEDGDRRAREETLRELLPIIDNLERAVSAAESATSPIAVAEGVRMVLKQFQEVASRLSLQRLAVVGERFDPALHDAVQQLETDEHEPGTIVSEVHAGYRVGERLLRPALVVVARPKAKTEEEAPESKPDVEA